MMLASRALQAVCLLSSLSNGLGFTMISSSINSKLPSSISSKLSMGYLDDLSPSQPNNDEENSKPDNSKPAPPINRPSGRLVPSGRGPLGSYLDAVSSGNLTPTNDQDDDDQSESVPYQPLPKPASWTNTYLANFLTDDDPRTDIRNLLTQRSIQSFMRLLEECRDPHSAKWIQEDFLQTGNLLDFHGTGAKFIEQFGGTWDSPLLEMIARPKDRIIVSAKRRGRGHGGWSKNNPFLEERWVEIPIDIDPANLAFRILSVREQIANEWVKDLDILMDANDQILDSFFETNRGRREAGGNVGMAMESGSFVRTSMNMMNDISRGAVTQSSPFRRSNFDLMYNLCTQAAIHRILRERKAAFEEREVSFIFLRDYYTGRAEEYFDGELTYGRADDFIDDLLQTTPSVLSPQGGGGGLVDPVGAAEEIIKMRKVVAQEWKALMERVSEDHTGVRQALFSSQMQRDSPQDVKNSSSGFQ
mmetsp:Transcript_23604/g.34978  ORF Transcript_23604/g.34978 Transcript_23604/m.34978 type:complete len:474 (-) Transcript_23604:108-1529(-)